ncbi:MAG: YraN family protein [Bacteroidales bacterium]|nr:YraN family protein [Bacteroidales bacterium]
MARHNEFGKWGEDIAAGYLTEHGFEILKRNWRSSHKEIDIVAQKDEVLHFVEVKTRHGEEWLAEAAIDARKRALMWKCMMAWKYEHPSLMPVRYSAIAVVVHDPDEAPEIRWHENVWELR